MMICMRLVLPGTVLYLQLGFIWGLTADGEA
jgi:hypothetical protein